MDRASARSQAGAEWSWPPYAPGPDDDGRRYHTEEWAPRSSVHYPWVRLGRWTLLYRRAS